jgi:hypothetical protein
VLPLLAAALAGAALLSRSSVLSPRAVGALFSSADARTEAAARRVGDRCSAAAAAAGPRARAPGGPACLAPPSGAGAGAAGAAGAYAVAAGAPLHIFLRLAAGERAHSGGARYLGLRKTTLALVRALASAQAARHGASARQFMLAAGLPASPHLLCPPLARRAGDAGLAPRCARRVGIAGR